MVTEFTIENGTYTFDHVFTARPGFQRPDGCSSSRKSNLEPVPVTENGFLPAEYVMEDPDSHFIYVCKKKDAAELLSLYRLRIDDLL